jgi:cell filamentation protein
MTRRDWLSIEDFVQPGTTNVLSNRLAIFNGAELERVERILSAARIGELELAPLAGGFDLAHLQAIHRYIFQDIYEWAGRIRPFDLSKDGEQFCLAQHIGSYAEDIFGRLRSDELLQSLDVKTFAVRAADLLADINALHPFREGNGRAQRAFLVHVANHAGHRLIWSRGDEQRNIAASRAALYGDNAALRTLVADSIETVV